MAQYHYFELRSVDALREAEGGWYWNDSFVLERDIIMHEDEITSRKVFKFLRDADYLADQSKGRLTLVEDWPVLEIQRSSDGRPFLALICEKSVEE